MGLYSKPTTRSLLDQAPPSPTTISTRPTAAVFKEKQRTQQQQISEEEDNNSDCWELLTTPAQPQPYSSSKSPFPPQTLLIPSPTSPSSSPSNSSNNNNNSNKKSPNQRLRRMRSWSTWEEDDDDENDSLHEYFDYYYDSPHSPLTQRRQRRKECAEEDNVKCNNNNFNKLPDSIWLQKSTPLLTKRRHSRPTAAQLALRHGPALNSPHETPKSATSPSFNNRNNNNNNSPRSKRHALPPSRWLLPVHHPVKVIWDTLTVLLSVYHAYMTHVAIRSEVYVPAAHYDWIQVWFWVDILLNFVTQRTTHDGTTLKNWQAVWARYLTSWFVFDVLALFPGERLYIQPILDTNRQRRLWAKMCRRTKITLKVTTRLLQSGHVPWLYTTVVKKQRLVHAIRNIVYWVKYGLGYFFFCRRMKGVLVVRFLSYWGHFARARRFCFGTTTKHQVAAPEDDTVDLSEDDNDDYESEEDDADIFVWNTSNDNNDDDDDDDDGPF